MKTIYQAVLVREEGGDLDIEEFSTLKNARKELQKMIGGKPYHDAYIRRFDYLDDDMSGRYTTRDYEIK